jgi:hypothetical protein
MSERRIACDLAVEGWGLIIYLYKVARTRLQPTGLEGALNPADNNNNNNRAK